MAERGIVYNRSTRALGIHLSDGSSEIIIDSSYYLRGEIRKNQLPAIARHEEVELTADKDHPESHLQG